MMNKAQNRNAEITWLSVCHCSAFIKMSSYFCVIFGFNVLNNDLGIWLIGDF